MYRKGTIIVSGNQIYFIHVSYAVLIATYKTIIIPVAITTNTNSPNVIVVFISLYLRKDTTCFSGNHIYFQHAFCCTPWANFDIPRALKVRHLIHKTKFGFPTFLTYPQVTVRI